MFSERCLWKIKKTSPAAVCQWRLIRFTLSNIDVMFQFVNPRTLDFSLSDVFEAIRPSDPFGFACLPDQHSFFYIAKSLILSSVFRDYSAIMVTFME